MALNTSTTGAALTGIPGGLVVITSCYDAVGAPNVSTIAIYPRMDLKSCKQRQRRAVVRA
jgi:hypothetical protein